MLSQLLPVSRCDVTKEAPHLVKMAALSEDIPGVKWDRCVADTLIKTGKKRVFIILYVLLGVGFGIGALCSLILFKRE